MITNPNIEWYVDISKKNGTTPRCPFATIQRCPRYYQSLSLLGRIGTNTSINPKVDKRILRKWQKTHFWPQVAEQETGITGSEGKPRGYRHFCPEVVYDNFGYFADSLHDFIDEIDMDGASRRLKTINAEKNDWRWHFMSLNPIHFTECYLYLLLQTHRAQYADIFEIKPNFYGIGLNLNALFRRLLGKPK